MARVPNILSSSRGLKDKMHKIWVICIWSFCSSNSQGIITEKISTRLLKTALLRRNAEPLNKEIKGKCRKIKSVLMAVDYTLSILLKVWSRSKVPLARTVV